jgi:hypothetical protein
VENGAALEAATWKAGALSEQEVSESNLSRSRDVSTSVDMTNGGNV